MRRILSIPLLAIFLFNTTGYYFFYLVVKQQHDLAFAKKLAMDEYSGSESMIVKIPFNLPYGTKVNFDGYERVEGEFIYNHSVYKMLKQTTVNDTLYVVLVKDKHKTGIQNIVSDFADGQQASNSKSASQVLAGLTQEFLSDKCQLSLQSTGWLLVFTFSTAVAKWRDITTQLLSPPPQLTRA